MKCLFNKWNNEHHRYSYSFNFKSIMFFTENWLYWRQIFWSQIMLGSRKWGIQTQFSANFLSLSHQFSWIKMWTLFFFGSHQDFEFVLDKSKLTRTNLLSGFLFFKGVDFTNISQTKDRLWPKHHLFHKHLHKSRERKKGWLLIAVEVFAYAVSFSSILAIEYFSIWVQMTRDINFALNMLDFTSSDLFEFRL